MKGWLIILCSSNNWIFGFLSPFPRWSNGIDTCFLRDKPGFDMCFFRTPKTTITKIHPLSLRDQSCIHLTITGSEGYSQRIVRKCLNSFKKRLKAIGQRCNFDLINCLLQKGLAAVKSAYNRIFFNSSRMLCVFCSWISLVFVSIACMIL